MRKAALLRVGMHISGSHRASDSIAQGPQYLQTNGKIKEFLERRFASVDEFEVNCAPTGIRLSEQEPIAHLDDIVVISIRVQELARQLFNDDYFVVLLGGEQTADLGFVAGAATSNRCAGGYKNGHGGLSVSSMDGHLDLNTIQTSNTGHIHGQTYAAHCGYGHPLLVNFHQGWTPRCDPSNAYVIGANTENVRFFTGQTTRVDNAANLIRQASYEAELENARKWGVKIITAQEIDDNSHYGQPNETGPDGYLIWDHPNPNHWRHRIRNALSARIGRTNGHIALCDLDHAHKSVAPGVAMQNEQGLQYLQSTAIATDIARAAKDKLMGVAFVEADPSKDTQYRTAHFVQSLLSHFTCAIEK